jgi:hypothetical protein
MGKQQTARASGGHPTAPSGGSSESPANPRENAARVAMRGNELPGWFWGLLGCLSVLGVGSAVLFLIFKPPSGVAAPPGLATTTAAADRTSAQRGAQIDIEPMAPPPIPAAEAPAPPKPKPARLLKIAHAPAASHPSTAGSEEPAPATEGESADSGDAPKVEAPRAKAKTKAAAADDDDQAAHTRKLPADDKPGDKSGDKSDDDKKSDDNKEL